MKIPFYYIYKNFTARKLTTGITVVGISLVVFVFAAVLMMAFGVEKTLNSTGSDDNIIITRKASTGEITSIIDRETANTILSLPGIAKSGDGKPLVSTDAVVVITADKVDGGMSNVTVRGVSPESFSLRTNVKVGGGRMFNWGARELVVGMPISKRFKGAGIGDKIRFAGDYWTIVGQIQSEGGAFESEIWCDVNQLLNAFGRNAFSTMTFRTERPDVVKIMETQFAADPRLNQFIPKIERKYFAEQSEMMALFIRILGIFITIIFSVGAMIGAMITMYASVANRTTEIGTLRALGFQRRSILAAFLFESLLISVIGGAIGIALASFLQFFSLSTMNFASWSELAFSFALSTEIIVTSLLFALLMGFAGGFLPSVRAARMSVLNALRGG